MLSNSSNMDEIIERQELISKLKEQGYTEFVDAFLLNDSKVYTKKGRLNKSGACRVLGCKPKQLEEYLSACKKILEKDIEI